jgi:hypothetical protein
LGLDESQKLAFGGDHVRTERLAASQQPQRVGLQPLPVVAAERLRKIVREFGVGRHEKVLQSRSTYRAKESQGNNNSAFYPELKKPRAKESQGNNNSGTKYCKY